MPNFLQHDTTNFYSYDASMISFDTEVGTVRHYCPRAHLAVYLLSHVQTCLLRMATHLRPLCLLSFL